MKLAVRHRPSAFHVLGVLGLSLVLAGSAVAGTDGLTRVITKSKVKAIAKKQANAVLNSREASLNVNTAKSATTATNANNANNANNAASLGGVPAGNYARTALPPGETITGTFGAGGTGAAAGSNFIQAEISFSPPLASDLCITTCGGSFERHAVAAPGTANCPGVGQAAPGFLCLYEGSNSGATFVAGVGDPQGGGQAIRRYGTLLYWSLPVGNAGFVRGNWALTAPLSAPSSAAA